MSSWFMRLALPRRGAPATTCAPVNAAPGEAQPMPAPQASQPDGASSTLATKCAYLPLCPRGTRKFDGALRIGASSSYRVTERAHGQTERHHHRYGLLGGDCTFRRDL